MKFISRTLTSLALATGLVLAGSAQAAEKVNIGIVTAPNFVHTIAALKFKEELDKALPGKYDVIIHHSAALGSETQVLQQLQLGTVQMSVCTTGPVEAFVPEVKALEMPFLFSSYEATDKVLDGPIGQDLLKRFEKVGLVGLHFLDNGFRNVTNSKRAVTSPADLQGLKIRTMESPTHLAIWRAIGANPTPMAWPITTQLQQGVLDGVNLRICATQHRTLVISREAAAHRARHFARDGECLLMFAGDPQQRDREPARFEGLLPGHLPPWL